MAVASPQDVAARLGRALQPPEAAQVAVLLADAETLILTRLPDLHTRIEHGVLACEVVVLVEASAVARVVRIPAGIRAQRAESYAVDYDTDSATGLEILPEEWRLLGLRTGLFTIRPVLPRPAMWGRL